RLVIAATMAWVVAGALFVARLILERHAIERELAELQEPLTGELPARREWRTAEATVEALRGAATARGAAGGVLAEVAAVLPDSTVLASLAWSADGSGALS